MRADREQRVGDGGEDRASRRDRVEVRLHRHVHHDVGKRLHVARRSRSGSASAVKRIVAVSNSPPANASASAPSASRSVEMRRNTRFPSVSDVKAAIGRRNVDTPAPGSTISTSSPGCASRIAPSDSGISTPFAGRSIGAPSGASKRCIVVSARNASSEVAYRRCRLADHDVGRRNRFGRGDAVDGAELIEVRRRHRRDERDLGVGALELRGGVEGGFGRVDHARGRDHARHGDRGGHRSHDRRTRAEGSRPCSRGRARRPRARAPRDRGEREPDQRDADVRAA